MDAANAERDEVARSLRHRLSIQRKGEGASGRHAAIPEDGGQPLGVDVRKRLEPKLGANLGDVRVHTGADSATAATQLGARAFTTGSDVHFGAGQFAPGTKEGDRLLAHELTHVVQGQRSGIQRKEADGAADSAHGHEAVGGHEVSQPGEPAEKEADAVADHVTDQLHDAGGDKKNSETKDGKQHHGKGGAGQKGADTAAGHGGAEHGKDSAAAEPQQQAPAVAAKLASEGRNISLSPLPIAAQQPSVGRKIFRAPSRPQAPILL